MKNNNDRLIVALDFENSKQAKSLVEELGDEVNFYKVGLELAMSPDYFELISWLAKKNKRVFADLKLYDIANTVAKAVKNLTKYDNIEFLTIHTASREIMTQANNNKGNIKILGVSILTNLDQNDLHDIGFDKDYNITDLVIKKSKLAKECGLDGVISSAIEAKTIRENLGDEFLIVTPGIRPDFLPKTNDDQKRVASVNEALNNGVNYIVVGRPITQNNNPALIAHKINQQLKK